MGKVLRADRGAVPSGKKLKTPSLGLVTSPGLDDEKRCVNFWSPRLLDVSCIEESAHIAWTPLPMSHIADRMFSWVVSNAIAPQMSDIFPAPRLPAGLHQNNLSVPRSLRVLVMFAFKHVKSVQLDRTELCEELRNIADTICSLNSKQRVLFGDRIVLFIVAYPSESVTLQDVLSSTDRLFPDDNGRCGAPGTELLTFATLTFETVHHTARCAT